LLDSDTRFVLTNTVYLDAGWKVPFDAGFTTRVSFTKLDSSQVQVDMMRLEDQQFQYAESQDYQAVALPYADEDLSFLAVLPTEGAYEKVEAALSGGWFDDWEKNRAIFHVDLGVPKFEYETSASMSEMLQALGMRAPFQSSADFSGITSEPIRVDHVLHEARVKVDEQGTIAVAATGGSTTRTSGPLDLKRVIFDRPFLFMIVDEPTGQILFLGRVLDPTQM